MLALLVTGAWAGYHFLAKPKAQSEAVAQYCERLASEGIALWEVVLVGVQDSGMGNSRAAFAGRTVWPEGRKGLL